MYTQASNVHRFVTSAAPNLIFVPGTKQAIRARQSIEIGRASRCSGSSQLRRATLRVAVGAERRMRSRREVEERIKPAPVARSCVAGASGRGLRLTAEHRGAPRRRIATAAKAQLSLRAPWTRENTSSSAPRPFTTTSRPRAENHSINGAVCSS